jgi:hypothetical protein
LLEIASPSVVHDENAQKRLGGGQVHRSGYIGQELQCGPCGDTAHTNSRDTDRPNRRREQPAAAAQHTLASWRRRISPTARSAAAAQTNPQSELALSVVSVSVVSVSVVSVSVVSPSESRILRGGLLDRRTHETCTEKMRICRKHAKLTAATSMPAECGQTQSVSGIARAASCETHSPQQQLTEIRLQARCGCKTWDAV